MPPGVINLVTGDGINVSKVALADPRPRRHPLHRLDADVPAPVAAGRREHAELPHLPAARRRDRRQGLHPGAPVRRPGRAADGAWSAARSSTRARSARPPRAPTCRAACGAAEERPGLDHRRLTLGDVTDLSNFMGAVIDERAFAKHKAAIDRAHATPGVNVVAGGTYDDSEGWFVRPTVLEIDDPTDQIFTTEYFGPILSVHVYPDGQYDKVLDQMESVSPFGADRLDHRPGPRTPSPTPATRLRFAAGNFYINDKPTGAVVGQQPFGGGRASGTNDKAGAVQNLLRWTSARSIKETFDPPKDHALPAHGLTTAGARRGRPGQRRGVAVPAVGVRRRRDGVSRRASRSGRAPRCRSPPRWRGGGLLDLAAEQRHLGLELGVEVLDGFPGPPAPGEGCR